MYRWRSGKESACRCRRHRRHGLDPWIRKIPYRKKWQPTPVVLPENFHGLRSLVGYSPCKESNMTEYTLYMLHGSAFHDSQKKHSSWFGSAAPFSLAFRKKPMKSDTKRLWRRIRAAFSFFFFLFVVNFVIHWNETAMGLHVFPIPIPPPTSHSTRSSRFSQCTRSERLSHASNLGWWSASP